MRTRYDHLTAVSELLVDMAASAVTAAGDPTERAAFNRGGGAGGRGLRMDLVDAGVGAAGTTVPSLATLNHTGHLQTCHH